jgi:hypothetical protein
MRIYFDDKWNLQFLFSKDLLIITLVVIALYAIFRLLFRPSLSYYEINEAEIGVGSQKIKIKPNQSDMQIAFKLYVELSTRKIGLPIDFDHDVIDEIYNSWYEFFKITRELIKEIPVTKVRNCQSTKDITRISIDVLNNGLRPALTKWQARYRRWYNLEIDKPENEILSPQDIQQKFPQFSELKEEMQIVNKNLIEYRKKLKELSMGVGKNG